MPNLVQIKLTLYRLKIALGGRFENFKILVDFNMAISHKGYRKRTFLQFLLSKKLIIQPKRALKTDSKRLMNHREILAELWHFEFHKKNVKKILIRPGQQFWRIFQVKYLSNDSSNQYGSTVILD